MKTTEWYRGDQKPVRVGVYQRLYRKVQVLFSYWDGWNWSLGCDTVNAAVVFGMPSHSQNIPWRGVEK